MKFRYQDITSMFSSSLGQPSNKVEHHTFLSSCLSSVAVPSVLCSVHEFYQPQQSSSSPVCTHPPTSSVDCLLCLSPSSLASLIHEMPADSFVTQEAGEWGGVRTVMVTGHPKGKAALLARVFQDLSCPRQSAAPQWEQGPFLH
jgi:hypothetical protein